MEKLPEIKLPGHPEAFATETRGRRLFVNVPKTDSIFVIDRSKAEVVGQWQLTKAKVNYTMAFDEAHSRLFVGCRNPASVVVLDSNTGREVATFPSAMKPTTCSTMGRINEYMSPGPKAHSTWWSKWTLTITASSQDW